MKPLRLLFLLMFLPMAIPSTDVCAAGLAKRDSLSLAQGKAALWRSAMFNGWGQAYNKEWIKAALFAGTEVALLVSAYGQHQTWQDWKTRREEEGRRVLEDGEVSLSDYYEIREDFYLRDRNKLIWWWFWSKLICGLDAYVSGSLSNFDTGWNNPLSINATRLHQGSPGISIRIRF